MDLHSSATIKTQTQNKVRFLLQLTLSLGVASRSQLAGKQQKLGVNNPHDIHPLHAKVDALKCCYLESADGQTQ